jgi:eukaryotic-like serine/threonine-protein kinase
VDDTPVADENRTPTFRPTDDRAEDELGPYRLLKKLGEGGMGTVWLAQQKTPVKRKVALKLIQAGKDSQQMQGRFEAERQALAAMDHPNIARMYDGGLLPDGRPFFAMELVDGKPLTQFCDEAKLGTRERLEIFVKMCHAVQHAHQKGIIHRDLKPGNIVVTRIDGRPEPKVIDFGVAKALGGKLDDRIETTRFDQPVGTYAYMSPEQTGAVNADIDTRADIYALGVTLYELLTGVWPFDLRKAALLEVLRIIREEEPSKPSTRLASSEWLSNAAAARKTEPKKLLGTLRGDLDWIALKCLEKDRNRRYETANGLAADVLHHLSDEPVLAGPPSALYRFHKLVRRNRGTVFAAAIVLIAVMCGTVGTLLGFFRAEEKRKEAEWASKNLQSQLSLTELERNRANKVRDEQHLLLQRLAATVLHRPEFKAKEFTTIRRELFDSILSGFRERYAAAGGQTPEQQTESVRALYALAILKQESGDTSGAKSAIAECAANAEAFARKFPESLPGRITLLRAYNGGTQICSGFERDDYLKKAKAILPTLPITSDSVKEQFHTYYNESVAAYAHDENPAGAAVAVASMRQLLPILKQVASQSVDQQLLGSLTMCAARRWSRSAEESRQTQTTSVPRTNWRSSIVILATHTGT